MFNRIAALVLCLIPLNFFQVYGNEFFEIRKIRNLKTAPKDGVGVWKREKASATSRHQTSIFEECLEITVSVKERISSSELIIRTYFFDESGKQISFLEGASLAGMHSGKMYRLPVILEKGVGERFFIRIPDSIKSSIWCCVVVFGDSNDLTGAVFPNSRSISRKSFPEKQRVLAKTIPQAKRRHVENRVIEFTTNTKLNRHPQLTLFLRPPIGVKDWSEVQGVLALVVLANNVEDIRRKMQAVDLDGDNAGTFLFANRHKLAVLAWGSRSVWDPRRNYFDYNKKENDLRRREFDLLANAWERAIVHFHKEYGLPKENFLMRGASGAAQWAKRLGLRKPDYFLAIHIDIPSSFDQPTEDAAKVLWCLTTGESEAGYVFSKRFIEDCRKMGYPIIYQAIPGLGHSGHPLNRRLGDAFFEFAITQKEISAKREELISEVKRKDINKENNFPEIWHPLFQTPPFYKDIVNQLVVESHDKILIPLNFRIPVPSKEIADIMTMNH